MIILICLIVAFTTGVLVGAVVCARLTPRVIARLPEPEQLAYARKVAAHRRR